MKLTFGMLFMVAAAPVDVCPSDYTGEADHSARLFSPRGHMPQTAADLRSILGDTALRQALLHDRGRMLSILKKGELRQELLKHPCFIRQMMNNNDLRQGLLSSREMMYGMLTTRDINREINRNRKMLEEIEKDETYRHLNQCQQAEFLEELLSEPVP